MATRVATENGLEVPAVGLAKPASVPSLGLIKGMVWEEEGEVFENRRNFLAPFFRLFGKNDEGSMDPVVLEGLRIFMEEQSEVGKEPKTLYWFSKKEKPKKSKKSVTWMIDVPYKHNESGEVFEGPVWSVQTYDPAGPAI